MKKYVESKKEGKLLKLVHDKDQQVRLAAIAGLGKVGKDDGFNALITLIADEDEKVRAASARALGELGNEHAVAHLVYRMEHETDQAVQGGGMLGPGGNQVYSGCLHAGMAQHIGQLYHIPAHPVKHSGKQVTQVVGKHL